MSESEDEMLTFQSGFGTICARGPGINKNNLTGLSFQSNETSTMNPPNKMRSQANIYRGYPQSELGSIYHERETSPVSMISDLGPRRFRNPYYPRSCHRSDIVGRSRSPISIRSMDTTTSLSAKDIANVLNNDNFNKHELQIIKDAINRLMKNKGRKRFERRRNRNLFLKGIRRKSGYDSGELGSDSSISSNDDRQSIRTVPYLKDLQNRNVETVDKSILIASNTQSGLNNNCIPTIKKHTIIHNNNKGQSSMNTLEEAIIQPESSQSTCNGNMTLKDRFSRGFLLPSQRFNTSTAQASKTNNNYRAPLKINNPCHDPEKHSNLNLSSEEEQIFPETQCSNSETFSSSLQRKIILEEENSSAECKRSKVPKPQTHAGHCNENLFVINKENDNTFKKPIIPIRKSKIKNSVAQEILISKSLQPLVPSSNQDMVTIEDPEPSPNHNQTEATQMSDVSMKPSFIKRKLFTQKLDLIGSKGSGSDSTVSSPQTKPVANKEKNKARKLVTSQSCLNRDVPEDDDNVMDLIHKIVPAEQINSTTASRRTNKSNPAPDDKWDVTSVISMCNSNDDSDTFTDEDIFNVRNTVKKMDDKNRVVKKPGPCKTKDCSVVIHNIDEVIKKNEVKSTVELPSKNITRVSNCVKSFWDTDLESDMETENIPTWKIFKPIPNTSKDTSHDVTLPPPPITSISKPERTNKGTILTVQALRNKINNKTFQSSSKNKSTNPTTEIVNNNCIDLNSKETIQPQKKPEDNTDKPKNCEESSTRNKKLDKPNNCKENSPRNKKLNKPKKCKESSTRNKKLDKINNCKDNSPRNKKSDKANSCKENSPRNKKLKTPNNCEENCSLRTRNKKVNNEAKKSELNISTTRSKKNDNIMKPGKSVEKNLTIKKKQDDVSVQAEKIVENSATKTSCRNKNSKRLLNCSGCENDTGNSKNQPKENAKLAPENVKVIATKRKYKKSILNLSLDTSNSTISEINISSRSLRSFNKSIKY